MGSFWGAFGEPKSTQNPRGVWEKSVLNRLDFDLAIDWSQDGSKTVLRGLLGGSWAVLGRVWGRSWGLLGSIWAVLGLVLDHLGIVLGSFGPSIR